MPMGMFDEKYVIGAYIFFDIFTKMLRMKYYSNISTMQLQFIVNLFYFMIFGPGKEYPPSHRGENKKGKRKKKRKENNYPVICPE